MMETRRVSGQGARRSSSPPPTAPPKKWQVTLVVDPTACDGHGVCAELFPERIKMDRWGFPIIDGEDIPAQLLEHANRAVVSCPRLALHLLEHLR